MHSVQTENKSQARSMRLWPGVLIVALQSLAWWVLPVVVPAAGAFGAFAALGCTLLFVLWWVFFSRVPWAERGAALALMVGAMAITPRVLHESIVTGGMGMLFYVYALPVLCLAFVAWAAASRRWAAGLRRLTMVVDDPARLWRLGALAHQRHHRRRLGVRLALGRDSRGAASGPGR